MSVDQLAHAILDELADMQATTERFDLQDQREAATKLPGILERAKALRRRAERAVQLRAFAAEPTREGVRAASRSGARARAVAMP
jgi:hypothetical protein